MARIAGVDLPKEKRIEVALTYLYGIGLSRSRVILENTGVDPSRRAVDLTDDDVNKLRQEIEGFLEFLLKAVGLGVQGCYVLMGCVSGRVHFIGFRSASSG